MYLRMSYCDYTCNYTCKHNAHQLFTCGSLRMQHVASFGFLKYFAKLKKKFNHMIKTIRLCHMVVA
jgi:hypothetical protein